MLEARTRHVAATGFVFSGTVIAAALLPGATATLDVLVAGAAAGAWAGLAGAGFQTWLRRRHGRGLPADAQRHSIAVALRPDASARVAERALASAGARGITRTHTGDAIVLRATTRWSWASNGERIEVVLQGFGTGETLVHTSSRPRLRTGFLDGGRSWRNVRSVQFALLEHEAALPGGTHPATLQGCAVCGTTENQKQEEHT